jgi:hypothetical protein
MTMPSTTHPIQNQLPVYPVYNDSAAKRWRREHHREDTLFREWEAHGCDIKSLVQLASLWVSRFSIKEDVKRKQRELRRLLYKVESACDELAIFLESDYAQQVDENRDAAKRDAEHYREEARKAALHSNQASRRGSPFNTDRFGRGADLQPLIAIQEEIRRQTGKCPGEAQLGVLIDFTVNACGLEPFDFDPESIKKSLGRFRKNPLNKRILLDLASTPLQKITNQFASQGNK